MSAGNLPLRNERQSINRRQTCSQPSHRSGRPTVGEQGQGEQWKKIGTNDRQDDELVGVRGDDVGWWAKVATRTQPKGMTDRLLFSLGGFSCEQVDCALRPILLV